jgi:hypothetical protein
MPDLQDSPMKEKQSSEISESSDEIQTKSRTDSVGSDTIESKGMITHLSASS